MNAQWVPSGCPVGAVRCRWVPLGATGCRWVLSGAGGCRWVPCGCSVGAGLCPSRSGTAGRCWGELAWVHGTACNRELLNLARTPSRCTLRIGAVIGAAWGGPAPTQGAGNEAGAHCGCRVGGLVMGAGGQHWVLRQHWGGGGSRGSSGRTPAPGASPAGRPPSPAPLHQLHHPQHQQ